MPQALLAAVPEIMAAVGPALEAGATSRVANFVEGKMSGSGDKKKESKTTPHVIVNISAYDRVVQLVTHDDKEVELPQEEPNN